MPDNTNEARAMTDRGPEWRAAEAAGLDMSLVELSLAKTPWVRMKEHDQALAFAQKLALGRRAKDHERAV